MGFTPNRLLQTDTYGDRQIAAIAVSRVLRNAFKKASLKVAIPDAGHTFAESVHWPTPTDVLIKLKLKNDG